MPTKQPDTKQLNRIVRAQRELLRAVLAVEVDQPLPDPGEDGPMTEQEIAIHRGVEVLTGMLRGVPGLIAEVPALAFDYRTLPGVAYRLLRLQDKGLALSRAQGVMSADECDAVRDYARGLVLRALPENEVTA